MHRRIKPQLPGDVLKALRRSAGFANHRTFASVVPMSETTLWRMETVTWETAPSDWKRTMDREDLEVLCRAGLMDEGDGWWEQFLTAFAWQHQVEKYGVEIYDDERGSVCIMAPISVEHVESLVQVLVTRETIRMRDAGGALGDAEAQALVDKVMAETILRLTTMDMILTLEMEVEIIPDSERTRALTELLGGSGAAETPYTRTLLFAYEWANAELAMQLGVSGVQ